MKKRFNIVQFWRWYLRFFHNGHVLLHLCLQWSIYSQIRLFPYFFVRILKIVYLHYLFHFVAEKSSVLYNMVTFNVAIVTEYRFVIFCNRCQCLITSFIYISVYSLSRRFMSDQNEAFHDSESALKKIALGLSQAIQRGIW